MQPPTSLALQRYLAQECGSLTPLTPETLGAGMCLGPSLAFYRGHGTWHSVAGCQWQPGFRTTEACDPIIPHYSLLGPQVPTPTPSFEQLMKC